MPSNKKRLSELLILADSINRLVDIPNCRKMRGYKNYYRIRMGDYRIGLELDNDTVVFKRYLHRKDIYKYFPNPK